jgi:catechol 2,3-dioxygenase-like lactoylglutathione lyase family enzyme
MASRKLPGLIGSHVLFLSADPEADRVFFRDVLGFRWADAGEGWLIFALPPAEAAFHPREGKPERQHAGHRMMGAVLYLMCADLRACIGALKKRGVRCSRAQRAPWGASTSFRLPSGSEIGLYEPTHPSPLKEKRK